MSFYFYRFARQIKKQTLALQAKKFEFNSYLQDQQRNNNNYSKLDLNNNDSNTNKSLPKNIKANPYYWAYTIKNKFKDLFMNYSKKQKLLTSEYSKKASNFLVKSNLNAVSTFSNAVISSLVSGINSFLGVISGGKITPIGLKTLKTKFLSKIKLIKRKLTLNNNYFEKFKNKEVFLNNNFNSKTNLYSIIEKNLVKQEFYEKLKNFLPFSVNMIIGSNFRKMNTYIVSPFYKQKFFDYKIKLKNGFYKNKVKSYKEEYDNFNKSLKKKEDSFLNKIHFLVFKLFKSKSKKEKIKILLFAFAFAYFFVFLLLKKIFNFIFLNQTKQDKRIKESLVIIEEIKKQNETLMNQQRDLVKKFQEAGK